MVAFFLERGLRPRIPFASPSSFSATRRPRRQRSLVRLLDRSRMSSSYRVFRLPYPVAKVAARTVAEALRSLERAVASASKRLASVIKIELKSWTDSWREMDNGTLYYKTGGERLRPIQEIGEPVWCPRQSRKGSHCRSATGAHPSNQPSPHTCMLLHSKGSPRS